MFTRLYTYTRLNPLPSVVGMLLFWGLFDSAIVYLSPVLASQQLHSNSEVGLLLASSSLAGAIFDGLLGHFVRRPHFRKFYLGMLAVCALTPFVLLSANTVWMFLISMALWGLYFDLCSFGNVDFASRLRGKTEGTEFFSLLQLVKGIGFLVSPIIVSFLLRENEGALILLLVSYIALAFGFYFLVIKQHHDHPGKLDMPLKKTSFLTELHVWKKISTKAIGPLVFIILFASFDATFMTIGPLAAESFRGLDPVHGLFVSAYWLPALFLGLYLPKIVKIFGAIKTAYFGLLIAALVVCLFPLTTSALPLIALVFLSSLFSSMCAPAISVAFAQAVKSDRGNEREIAALQDFAANLGYIIGPVTAGFLSDSFSYMNTFLVMGVIVTAVVCVLIVVKQVQKRKNLLN